MRESAVRAKRELGLVWRATGAVRNARLSRGPGGIHPEGGRRGRKGVQSDQGLRLDNLTFIAGICSRPVDTV